MKMLAKHVNTDTTCLHLEFVKLIKQQMKNAARLVLQLDVLNAWMDFI
jgi:hypothetical protein